MCHPLLRSSWPQIAFPLCSNSPFQGPAAAAAAAVAAAACSALQQHPQSFYPQQHCSPQQQPGYLLRPFCSATGGRWNQHCHQQQQQQQQQQQHGRKVCVESVLRAFNLEGLEAHKASWAQLGLLGALRLSGGPPRGPGGPQGPQEAQWGAPSQQFYGGPRRERLIFLVEQQEAARLWAAALAALHAAGLRLLLGVDLEWSPAAAAAQQQQAAAAAQQQQQQQAGATAAASRVALLQLCVEKQQQGDEWPPCSEAAAEPTPLPAAAAAAAAACASAEAGASAASAAAAANQNAALLHAAAAAADLGFVLLFDLAEEPQQIMEHLKPLLEDPKLPKVVNPKP
ncbi:hypothetical protein, conserved [Eimeria tenella]|uniref:Uncharacterized protein n=1 Tax=Eimeria tenella TaxID=5802 RepID=U6KRJ6_EIMTE|nr:hypothetical protein, conserved [Eimeria tenella]CDJ39538.1 hypothetical protein, conserved [Eimeria tenella]|eukprot:XP_013230293.1 hypothetical protein, conserved [Eimeria tenella]